MSIGADAAPSGRQEEPERPLGPPAIDKLTSWDLYRSMGSPKYVVAPMVDQSELAWRVLSRLHGSNLAYTPMFHAGLFANPANTRYQLEQFDTVSDEEGDAKLDRPLTVQFCSNDKDVFLAAATRLAESGKIDCVDLNLGCPQGIAKRGHYGAFLMEDWGLIESMINHLHKNLSVPVTAKFRVYDDLEKTLDYARMLERAGAQILTVHGRTREQKGQLTGLADWDKIRKVKQAVSVPVFANGNILAYDDVDRCIEATGVDGIMSAEGNLYNPAVFEPLNRPQAEQYRAGLPVELLEQLNALDQRYTINPKTAAFYPLSYLSMQYLIIVKTLKTKTGISAIKAHLFRMWKAIFVNEDLLDLRESLSRISSVQDKRQSYQAVVDQFIQLTENMTARIQKVYEAGQLPLDPMVALGEEYTGKAIPYSHAQPYLRPLPATDVNSTATKRGQAELSKEDLALDPATGDAKRAKTQAESPSTTGKVQVLQPVVLCSICKQNNASQRCVRNVCRACCFEASKATDAEVCEDHTAKARKDQEKKDARKRHKEAKKEAKQTAREKGEAKKQMGKSFTGDDAAALAARPTSMTAAGGPSESDGTKSDTVTA